MISHLRATLPSIPGYAMTCSMPIGSLIAIRKCPRPLKGLKEKGARLAILSNGSPAMLESAVRSAALDVLLDDVISVDEVRKYKTAPAVYELITLHWRLYPSAISFQSSNRWDVAGAVRFGMRGVWINRSNQPDEYKEFAPALILPSLQLLD